MSMLHSESSIVDSVLFTRYKDIKLRMTLQVIVNRITWLVFILLSIFGSFSSDLKSIIFSVFVIAYFFIYEAQRLRLSEQVHILEKLMTKRDNEENEEYFIKSTHELGFMRLPNIWLKLSSQENRIWLLSFLYSVILNSSIFFDV